jgi:N-acyl-D-amino-acid deacylase
MASYDLVIRGGMVFDGTGAESIRADIGLIGDRIAAVGDLTEAAAGRVLCAEGLCVAPGFVDIHTHSDISVLYNPGQASSVAMGVTTQVTGNCALSVGLVTRDPAFEFEQRWLAPHGTRITWRRFDEFLRRVETQGVANNFVPLVGHGSLRKRVMGLAERAPDIAEMAALRRELEAALDAGAWGLSSGLEYVPSSYATIEELAELCRPVAECGGLYATHLRNEGDTLIEAVEEALAVATRASVPLQLSHHKAEGRANWGKVRTTLSMVAQARAQGLDVQLDQYPYPAFMTALSVQVLPLWAQRGTAEETVNRLRDPARRAAILAEIREAHPDWDDLSPESVWQNIQVGVCRSRPELQGQCLAALAREAERNPLEYVLDLLIETDGYVSAVNFAIAEADIAEVMRFPWTAIGSDGVGTCPEGKGGADRVHPRSYGTFPRVLGRYARELGVLTEAQAIHKMTGLPAARLGLSDRGLLRPGFFADITLYDPATIGDRATFDAPHQFAAGIAYVLCNGRLILENGQPTGTLAGRVLRRP